VAKKVANSLKEEGSGTERNRVQALSYSPSNTMPRTERIRVRRARRRVLFGLQVIGAIIVLSLSAGVAFSVFSLHLGIRPVLTGSMRPDYGPGAVLFTRRIPTSTLRPGMIVLFVPPGEHAEYAHRITSVSGPASTPVVTTKGDANKVGDPWHAKITAPYVNRVIGSIPSVGRILVAIRGTGQIVLALVGGLFAIWGGTRWFAASASRSSRRRLTPGGA